MHGVRISGTLRKVGNTLAVFIPAAEARKGGLAEGQRVVATIEANVPSPFGLLKGIVPYEPFDRHAEERKRDRI